MLSSPVTNCESPDGVAMNPSRLCPRWPMVMGRRDVAEQIGRYRFRSSDRASPGASRDRHPPPGDHARTASGSSGFTGRSSDRKSSPNVIGRPVLSSGSASAAAPRTMFQAVSTVGPCCSCDSSTLTYSTPTRTGPARRSTWNATMPLPQVNAKASLALERFVDVEPFYFVAAFWFDEPANSRLPSSKVMLVALAVLDPFRAW